MQVIRHVTPPTIYDYPEIDCGNKPIKLMHYLRPRSRISTCLLTHTHIHTYTKIHTDTETGTHKYTHTHKRTYKHSHTNSYSSHKHTHTQTNSRKAKQNIATYIVKNEQMNYIKPKHITYNSA